MSNQPPEIKICPACSATPIANENGDTVFWCRHTGSLISQSSDTGAAWGIAHVLPGELEQFLKNRQHFIALAAG